KELKKGIPYFRVDELQLRKIGGERIEGINFLYDRNLLKHENELNELNKKIEKNKNNRRVQNEAQRELNKILKCHSRDKSYIPYQTEISFDLNEVGNVIKIGKVGECSNRGYILSGGFILGKRSHYVVPEEDSKLAEEKY